MWVPFDMGILIITHLIAKYTVSFCGGECVSSVRVFQRAKQCACVSECVNVTSLIINNFYVSNQQPPTPETKGKKESHLKDS